LTAGKRCAKMYSLTENGVFILRRILKIICSFLMFSLILNGCYNVKAPENSSSESHEETEVKEIEMGQIVSQGNYYVVFRGKYNEDWMHYYRILDENGEEIKTVSTWMDEAKITEMKDGILKISIQTGFDDTSVKTTYFDIKTNRTSPDRYGVLAEKNDYVAYVSGECVLISGMFNGKEIKKIEIGPLSEDSKITAEFDETATSVDVVINGKTTNYKI
jgi:hypothetical protein